MAAVRRGAAGSLLWQRRGFPVRTGACACACVRVSWGKAWRREVGGERWTKKNALLVSQMQSKALFDPSLQFKAVEAANVPPLSSCFLPISLLSPLSYLVQCNVMISAVVLYRCGLCCRGCPFTSGTRRMRCGRDQLLEWMRSASRYVREAGPGEL